MGCCQAKDANKTVNNDSNVNLENKKDEEQQKATLATTTNQPPKEAAQVEEQQSVVRDQSSMKGPKKKAKKEFDPASFAQDILREINLFRSNPKNYADKIRNHIQYIKEEKDKLIYHNGDVKTSLSKGVHAFTKVADDISNISPLGNLELTDEVKVECPDEVDQQATAHKTLLPGLKSRFSGKKIALTFDLGSPVAENVVVLQLVDDTKSSGTRRNVFLDNSYSHLGVSAKKSKGKSIAIYLTFSD